MFKEIAREVPLREWFSSARPNVEELVKKTRELAHGDLRELDTYLQTLPGNAIRISPNQYVWTLDRQHGMVFSPSSLAESILLKHSSTLNISESERLLHQTGVWFYKNWIGHVVLHMLRKKDEVAEALPLSRLHYRTLMLLFGEDYKSKYTLSEALSGPDPVITAMLSYEIDAALKGAPLEPHLIAQIEARAGYYVDSILPVVHSFKEAVHRRQEFPIKIENIPQA